MTVYAGDRPRIRVDTGIDLEDTNPPTRNILVQNPDGTTQTWAATVEAPASGGILYYDVGAGELADAGAYIIQAQVQRTSDTNVLPLGASAHLEVHEPYQ